MSHRTIRVGMIGSGGIARYHIGNLLQIPSVEVVALSDPNPAMRDAAKFAYPAIKDAVEYDDYEKMLDTESLDAVQIHTPHTLHLKQMQDAFGKGLSVLCEKPLATTVADAHAAIAARDAAGKVGLLSYQRHFQPEFRFMREKIMSGEFGPVTFVSALQCQGWKKGTAGTWRQVPELSGGGQLNDSGSHLVDIILWVTGLAAESVSCYNDNRGTPVDIDSALAIKFRNGAMGSLTIVGDAQTWHEDISIWCEKGTFHMRQGQGLSFVDEKGNRFECKQLMGGSNPDRNFIEAIRDGAPVESPFECGLRVIELTEAAWKSAANGGAPSLVA